MPENFPLCRDRTQSAVAAPTASFAKSRLNVPADQWLPPLEIADKLSPQGYEVLEIDSDDGAYEGEMLDKNRVKVDTPYIPRRPSSARLRRLTQASSSRRGRLRYRRGRGATPLFFPATLN